MQIIQPNQTIPQVVSAITIGKFDGVHLGHRELLSQTRRLAGTIGGPAGVVTFDRHPLEILRPGSAPPFLTPLDDRLGLLDEAGMDFCVLLPLTGGVLDWPADRFVEDVIVRCAHAGHVVTGGDFRYGLNREGGIPTLEAAGAQHGFAVHVVPPVMVAGRRVSSYAIRNAVQASDFALAAAMLGRPYSVSGRVERGHEMGRTLGYPTANVRYDPGVVLPALGVYAVTTDWGEGEHAAVANLGVRPTVETGAAPVWLEVHVIDWTGDIYDRDMRVSFEKLLRGEQRFPSVEALKAQIASDVIVARDVLGR